MKKTFDHKTREGELYDLWTATASFAPKDEHKAPHKYIPMPPPNITGQLHMGHAMGTTLQDVLARHWRSRGYRTLFLPGFDHAGIATQEKLDQHMAEHSIPHYLFQQTAQEWEQKHRDRIRTQLKALGASADWGQERYTLDRPYEQATREAFFRLHDAGLIYHADGQWRLKLSELAQPLIEALWKGELDIQPAWAAKKILLTPDGELLSEARDWEISRQIQWGHPIPMIYMWAEDVDGALIKEDFTQGFRPNKETRDEHIQRQFDAFEAFKKELPNGAIARYELTGGVLDTWFSSSLWMFAALGWPEETPDLTEFFRNGEATLETGHDILFFWAAKMSMMSLALTGQLPFKHLYLHGLIRDGENRKMSKSRGNGIDPLELIEEYGADALRISLAIAQSPGQDIQWTDDIIDRGRKITTKLWNASRWILKHTEPGQAGDPGQTLSNRLGFIDKYLEGMDFRGAATETEQAIRGDLNRLIRDAHTENPTQADIAKAAARAGLIKILIAAHPFMPYITEAIWQELPETDGTLANYSGDAYQIIAPEGFEALSFSDLRTLLADGIQSLENPSDDLTIQRSTLGRPLAPCTIKLFIKKGMAQDGLWISEHGIINARSQKVQSLDVEDLQVLLGLEPSLANGIQCQCHSDDYFVNLEFDASEYFQDAEIGDLIELSHHDWKHCQAADEIAYFYGQDNAHRLFEYLENRPLMPDGDPVGFECEVNPAEAMAWLRRHRKDQPSPFKKILKANYDYTELADCDESLDPIADLPANNSDLKASILKIRTDILAAPTPEELRRNRKWNSMDGLIRSKNFRISDIKAQVKMDSGISLEGRTWRDLFSDIQELKNLAGIPLRGHPAEAFLKSRREYILFVLCYVDDIRSVGRLLQTTQAMLNDDEAFEEWRREIAAQINPAVCSHPLAQKAFERLESFAVNRCEYRK
jgi:methionyl-tRNA synthetase